MNTDRIEKRVVLKAPLARVWKAVSDSAEFGSWFGAKFEGPFVAGAVLAGKIVGTTVDPEVAKHQAAHAGTPFEVAVERIEPERELAFRWHPYGCEPDGEGSPGYSTLVEFKLRELPDGVELTVVESGFDQIPPEKRLTALEMNTGGWEAQTMLIRKYLEQHP